LSLKTKLSLDPKHWTVLDSPFKPVFIIGFTIENVSFLEVKWSTYVPINPKSRVMKILCLSSKINAKHEIAKNLSKKGAKFFISETVEEAIKSVDTQGDSIDIALVHREGRTLNDTPGFKFFRQAQETSFLCRITRRFFDGGLE
jgi:hypothetical protein